MIEGRANPSLARQSAIELASCKMWRKEAPIFLEISCTSSTRSAIRQGLIADSLPRAALNSQERMSINIRMWPSYSFQLTAPNQKSIHFSFISTQRINKPTKILTTFPLQFLITPPIPRWWVLLKKLPSKFNFKVPRGGHIHSTLWCMPSPF